MPVSYKVTGVTRDGRRFKAIHTKNYHYAMGINLYRGTVWYKDAEGKWRVLCRVWN